LKCHAGHDSFLLWPKTEATKKLKTRRFFMKDDGTATKGTPFSPKDQVGYSPGSVVSKTLLKKDTGNLTLFAFDSGQGLSEHVSPFDAVVYILDGRAEITIGGEIRPVETGEMLVMPAGISHALHASEPFKMLLIMIRGN
jgi:quercetin dioxygenase-like cupin family protein